MKPNKLTKCLLCMSAAFAILTAGNLAWVPEAEAQVKPRPKSVQLKPTAQQSRQVQRRDVARSRVQATARTPMTRQQANRNTTKADARKSAGWSAKAVTTVVTGAVMSVATPAGVQPVAGTQSVTRPAQQNRQSQRLDVRTTPSGRPVSMVPILPRTPQR